MTDAKFIRISKKFFDDHFERELPTPEICKSTKSHYWISANDPYLLELLNDAKYYVSAQQGMDSIYSGLCASARATCKAIELAFFTDK